MLRVFFGRRWLVKDSAPFVFCVTRRPAEVLDRPQTFKADGNNLIADFDFAELVLELVELELFVFPGFRFRDVPWVDVANDHVFTVQTFDFEYFEAAIQGGEGANDLAGCELCSHFLLQFRVDVKIIPLTCANVHTYFSSTSAGRH